MSASSSTVAGERSRPSAHHPREPGLSLRNALILFTRVRSARAIFTLFAASVVLRLAVGGFSLWDLAVVAAIVALHPFSEWVIHVGILHWRPRKLGRWTIDTELAREHRAHHVAPHDPKHWYIPLRSGLIGFVISSAIVGIIAPTIALWLSFLVGVTALGLVYEWTHYLCHTSYRPRGRLYRKLWRHHRLHHFKNENYWMGVTMHLGDYVLHTMPSPRDVETSPTCRDLLGRDGMG